MLTIYFLTSVFCVLALLSLLALIGVVRNESAISSIMFIALVLGSSYVGVQIVERLDDLECICDELVLD